MKGLQNACGNKGVNCMTSTAKISLQVCLCVWWGTDLGNYFK